MQGAANLDLVADLHSLQRSMEPGAGGGALDAVYAGAIAGGPRHGQPEYRQHVTAGQVAQHRFVREPAAQVHVIARRYVVCRWHAAIFGSRTDPESAVLVGCGQPGVV